MASIFETTRPSMTVTRPALNVNLGTGSRVSPQLAAQSSALNGHQPQVAKPAHNLSVENPGLAGIAATGNTAGLAAARALTSAQPVSSAAAAPGSGVPAPQSVDTYSPGALMANQYRQSQPLMQATQQLGANIQGQGAQVANQQNAQAAAYNQTGQNFSATSQAVAPQFGVGDQLSMKGGTAAPAALRTSQLGAAPSIGQISNVAGQLGNTPQAAGVGGIAGQLGAAPGAVTPGQLGGYSQVAGQLGGGYQVGSVGGIASQLGAGPQVGNVGNIQMGAGPGAVMPQLGNMGQQSGDQQAMMSRLNGFLDSPDGPSVAQSQLQSAQADNMANLLGAARSGRGGAGAQAQALRGAMSEGSAIMSDTAGQLATLRAQEADMLKNRQLSAIGLGGDMATAARGQDLGFRGQDLAALQGDQGAALGARGQDLQSAMANQSTQTQLEQLRAQTDLGARGQNLAALQGDQSTALGLEGLRANTATTNRGQDLSALTADQQASIAARGQNLSALQGNQSTALGARGQNLGALQGDQSTAAQMSLGQLQADLMGRGQNLSALQGDQSTALGREGLAAQTALGARGQDLSLLQGNQSTALGARGQDVTRELGLQNVNLGMRGQDAGVLMGDADRNLAAQRLGLDAGLGYGNLANTASGQGLQFLNNANQQGMMTQGMQNDLLQSQLQNQTSLQNTETAGRYGIKAADASKPEQMGFWEQLALNTVGGVAQGGSAAGVTALLSDERAKTDISPLDAIAEHLRGAPGYRYRYKPGVGEDPGVEHAGPMAQDLERGPFGKALVKPGPDGFKRVDTGRLSLVNHAALASMRSELDRLKAQLEG
jgi:hypothetical protein